MNLIRLLRSQAGVTQQALALKAGTSQPTIALYESGSKSPTITTVQKLAASLGFELVANYTPQLTREDQRSLAYHHAITEKIKQDPVSFLERAKQTLKKMMVQRPFARELLVVWQQWLTLPLDDLLCKMLDPAPKARELRQVSPFAGFLSPKERVVVLKQLRKELLS